MKKALLTFLFFVLPGLAFTQIQNKSVSCPSPDFPQVISTNKNSIAVMIFWFQADGRVRISYVTKYGADVTKDKFLKSYRYFEDVDSIRWGDNYKLDRRTLKYSYTAGVVPKLYERNCELIHTQRDIDVILDNYFKKSKALLEKRLRKNKI